MMGDSLYAFLYIYIYKNIDNMCNKCVYTVYIYKVILIEYGQLKKHDRKMGIVLKHTYSISSRMTIHM